MTTPAIPCGNLQNFFATLSNNTLDFNMYLQNTVQLNNQVQSFIKNTFKSIGLEKIIVPSLHYDAPEMFKGGDLDLLKSKAMEATVHRQKSPMAIQPYEKKPLVKRSELIQKKIKQEQMDSYVRMPQGYQELKRMASDQVDAYAKVEDQYHVSKKMKTQYSEYNHYETGSETSSNGSPGYNEFYIKQEDYSELARRHAPVETDHPVKVLGVKVDKQTKATWYLVEWQQRRDGVKPINSYIRKEDVPKESYHLVANFFERQLISKMAA